MERRYTMRATCLLRSKRTGEDGHLNITQLHCARRNNSGILICINIANGLIVKKSLRIE